MRRWEDRQDRQTSHTWVSKGALSAIQASPPLLGHFTQGRFRKLHVDNIPVPVITVPVKENKAYFSCSQHPIVVSTSLCRPEASCSLPHPLSRVCCCGPVSAHISSDRLVRVHRCNFIIMSKNKRNFRSENKESHRFQTKAGCKFSDCK